MKIIELVLDEEQEGSGIEAISIVESPAIEEDFIALKSDEIKLAEISKDKKLLMGALLVPNKPIYRKSDKEEYYIYFSKDTILKASQLYLKNGNQNNSTLEHQHQLSGLTLVESWIVESETQDKSRLYNLNVPVGTWMGTVKVNNDEVWNEYVKTNKVKGFSIEGYFADKMEDKKEPVEESFEIEAQELLSKIEKIVKGEKVELKNISVINQKISNLKSVEADADKSVTRFEKAISVASKEFDILLKFRNEIYNETYREAPAEITDFKKAAKDLGINPDNMSEIKELEKLLNTSREVIKVIDAYKRPQI